MHTFLENVEMYIFSIPYFAEFVKLNFLPEPFYAVSCKKIHPLPEQGMHGNYSVLLIGVCSPSPLTVRTTDTLL